MTADAFLGAHVRVLSERFEVHLVVNGEPAQLKHPGLAGAVFHRARIERAISPVADILGIVQLYTIMHRERFDAVHSLTPKAGLLAAIAAFLARVPLRAHTFTGQVWATRHGVGRRLLKMLDTLTARLDTHVFVDSPSQRDFLRTEHVLAPDEGILIGKGSVSGVDAQRFRADPQARAAVRAALAIPDAATLFIYVGRLARDKGVLELATAFGTIAGAHEDRYLAFVGPDEEGLESQIRERCPEAADRVRFAGWSSTPERHLAAADVFCLPSRREGFGSTIVEAAAASVPAIGSRIYGVVDAIEDGVTGLLFDPHDAAGLAGAMETLAATPELRRAMGVAAQSRALRDFSEDAVTRALEAFYVSALARRADGAR